MPANWRQGKRATEEVTPRGQPHRLVKESFSRNMNHMNLAKSRASGERLEFMLRLQLHLAFCVLAARSNLQGTDSAAHRLF